MKLRDIAERLQCRLEGDGDVEILRVAGILQALTGDLTFVANPKYAAQLERTHASAVILGEKDTNRPPSGCAVLRAADPYSAFARALVFFAPAAAPVKGVDPLSAVASDVTLGADVSIGPLA